MHTRLHGVHPSLGHYCSQQSYPAFIVRAEATSGIAQTVSFSWLLACGSPPLFQSILTPYQMFVLVDSSSVARTTMSACFGDAMV
jgi:hypothetical protein